MLSCTRRLCCVQPQQHNILVEFRAAGLPSPWQAGRCTVRRKLGALVAVSLIGCAHREKCRCAGNGSPWQ